MIPSEPIDLWLQFAERGDAKAQFNLGYYYTHGGPNAHADQVDLVEGIEWLRKAANRGLVEAQRQLGLRFIFLEPKNHAEGIKWLMKGAEQGDAECQTGLGWCFDTGCGVSQNSAESLKWYRMAAQQGNSDAQAALGLAMYKGVGTSKDWAESEKWIRKAADNGNLEGQGILGEFYSKGDCVPKDDVLAYMWLNLAAGRGHERSRANREILAKQLTSEQLSDAQELCRDWKSKT